MSSNRKKKEKLAVAYLRVSTKKQGLDGIGLDGQRAAIEKHAELDGLHIIGWHHDVASGMGETSAAAREGLQRALESARAHGCPILVSGIDRFSRDSKTVERIVIKEGISLISTDGLALTPAVIMTRAARAEAEGLEISRRTRQALQQKKLEGVMLGNRTNLNHAQKKGSAANKDRAAAKIEELADFLERHPSAERMSAGEVAQSLNEAGVLSGRGKPWTASGIRRPLAAALRLLTERRLAEEAMKKIPDFGRFS